MAEKTAVHIGFAIFCMAAMHGDTSKKKKEKWVWSGTKLWIVSMCEKSKETGLIKKLFSYFTWGIIIDQ